MVATVGRLAVWERRRRQAVRGARVEGQTLPRYRRECSHRSRRLGGDEDEATAYVAGEGVGDEHGADEETAWTRCRRRWGG